MSRIAISLVACLTLAVVTANARPQLDFDQIFGNGNSSCTGTSLGGYCCQGSIINPSGDYMNNNQAADYGSMTCCVGDPSHGFNNGGPSACTAGSAVPLTEAATASAAPAGSASSIAPADNTASASVISGSSSSSAGGSGPSQATQTGTSSSPESGDSSDSSAPSNSVATQSSDGSAAQMMATMAPVVGGVILGFAGLL